MRIYIAGPYSGKTPEEIQANVDRAIDAGLILWKRGHCPYIPHLTHYVDLRAKETGVKMEWEEYIRWDKEWLRQCDAILFLGPSRGALIELEYAKKLGKRVFLRIEDIPSIVACEAIG